MAAGRPKFKVTDEVLEKVGAMAARGLNLKEMAGVLGIHIDTFIKKRKEYSELNESIEGGRAKGVGQVKNKFFEKATDGDNHCMTMYLKNYSDLKDKHDVQHSGGISVNMPLEDAETL